MLLDNYGNHMGWGEGVDMMDWNFDSMGTPYFIGIITIFILITFFLILSRRISYRNNSETLSQDSKISEVSTQNNQYKKKSDDISFYCIHCGFQLHNLEIKFCPECGAPTSR